MPKGLQPPKNDFNQRGHFYELFSGSGTNVFKVNYQGLFMGGNNFDDAPFSIDYNGLMTATDGFIKGDFTVTGTITAGSPTGSEIKLDGTTGKIEFYYNEDLLGDVLADLNGNISFYSTNDLYFGSQTGQILRLVDTTGDVELRRSGTSVAWTSGRKLTDGSSSIICDGDFIPTADEANSLGTSGNSWDAVWANTIIADGTNAKFSINGNDGENANESGVTDFDITIIGGIITSFTKN